MAEYIDDRALAKKVLADYKKEEEYQKDLQKIEQKEFERTKTGKFLKVASKTGKNIIALSNKMIKPVKGRSIPKPVNPGVVLSKTQMAINELFNGERTFGTGQNLPKINGALTSGGGLIKHSDRIERRTAGLFGLR